MRQSDVRSQSRPRWRAQSRRDKGEKALIGGDPGDAAPTPGRRNEGAPLRNRHPISGADVRVARLGSDLIGLPLRSSLTLPGARNSEIPQTAPPTFGVLVAVIIVSGVRMQKKLLASVALLAAVMSAALNAGTAGTAAAETRVFKDRADAAYAPDVRGVSVTFEDRFLIRARHTGTPLSVYTFIEYWIDTKPRNPGPEYYSSAEPNGDADYVLFAVDGFRDKSKARVKCPRARSKADVNTNEPLRLRIPARCLDSARKARVSLRVREAYATRAFYDWAPGPQKFFRWVDQY